MKIILWLSILFLCFPYPGITQRPKRNTHLLKISEDNDYLNIRGHGTDKWYTHGFSLEYFYEKQKASKLFRRGWLPTAGPGQRKTYSWGLMQTMITPSDLSQAIPDQKDYPYSCSITAFHKRHFSNSEKHISIQIETLLGIMGPMAMGKQTQTAMHRLIHDELPKGWGTECANTLLANINLTVEKKLISSSQFIEFIGGSKSSLGTALNSLSIYTLLRIGKMTPYFQGYISQYSSSKYGKNRWQVYNTFKPALDLIGSNAMIEGQLRLPSRELDATLLSPTRNIRHLGLSFDYSIVVNKGKFSITFTQRWMYAMIQHQKRHEVGNLSLYFAL